jgi:Zn-dependent protease
MDFLNLGIPLGRYFGINVRLHFTFLIYAFQQVQRSHDFLYGFVFIAGLYLCILAHEFGHALAARWADGEATDILLWPLGGLAYCRPAWHPTAHLICTVAGPFVSLLIWLGLGLAYRGVSLWWPEQFFARQLLSHLSNYNLVILLFNLIPAFPMDGGRILRDTLWHWMSAEKATSIAVWTSRGIAAGGILWAVANQDYWLILMALFILWQAQSEYAALAYEAAGHYGFSLRERLKRGRRQRAFVAQRAEVVAASFHRCTSCGRTEQDDRYLEFRICSDCSGGQEYCRDHIDSHPHV